MGVVFAVEKLTTHITTPFEASGRATQDLLGMFVPHPPVPMRCG